MAYEAKDYSKLIGMEGFSETLLKNHFTLYQGYVTNTNKLMDMLASMLKEGKVGTPEYAELKRRMGWEFNGMRLHEYYFDNLGGKAALDKAGKLAKKLAENFGSYEDWERDGSKNVRERANERAKQILRDHWPDPLDTDIKKQIQGFIHEIEKREAHRA